MIRTLLFLALAALPLRAEQDFSPVISIASPDTATTFVFGTIKSRALIWNESTRTLSAEVTFEDEQQTAQATDDTHRFRIPGITLDKAKGIFYATSAAGEAVPIARRKKELFLSTIEVLPNAIVRVFHHHGDVSVTLEAIRPSELALIQKEQAAGDTTTNRDGSHTINLQDVLP
jgi:hypothetical protein